MIQTIQSSLGNELLQVPKCRPLQPRRYETACTNPASSHVSPHSRESKNSWTSWFITSGGISQATTRSVMNLRCSRRRNSPNRGGYILGRCGAELTRGNPKRHSIQKQCIGHDSVFQDIPTCITYSQDLLRPLPRVFEKLRSFECNPSRFSFVLDGGLSH